MTNEFETIREKISGMIGTMLKEFSNTLSDSEQETFTNNIKDTETYQHALKPSEWEPVFTDFEKAIAVETLRTAFNSVNLSRVHAESFAGGVEPSNS